ncbi:MAG: hypothetical protein DMG44_17800 [Acidobacteria bacterium]|nr:MAG: hypothetical protein DMG44_17800 [Acidobacteriota bacterium]
MGTENNPLINSLKHAASDKNSVAVVQKARALAWLRAIEQAISLRRIFGLLAWLAVVLALVSVFRGARWAVVSVALSACVLAHTVAALLIQFGIFANSFAIIQEVYKRDVVITEKQNAEKKQAEGAPAQSTSTKIN